MKATLALAAAAVLAATTIVAVEQTWTGRIVVTGRAVMPQAKYAFVWDFNGGVYQIANPDYPGLARHPGHPITLTGVLKNNAITVSRIEGVQPLAQLRKVFPASGAFSAESGEPPHFTVFATDPLRNPSTRPIGFVFWTTDLVPEEYGYHGPIMMLVGMDTTGILTGVVVVDNSEPYGRMSVERPEFAAQFTGKSVRDPFRVGGDVDAVSGASISIASATRAIRDSARMVARQLLTPEAVK